MNISQTSVPLAKNWKNKKSKLLKFQPIIFGNVLIDIVISFKLLKFSQEKKYTEIDRH